MSMLSMSATEYKEVNTKMWQVSILVLQEAELTNMKFYNICKENVDHLYI